MWVWCGVWCVSSIVDAAAAGGCVYICVCTRTHARTHTHTHTHTHTRRTRKLGFSKEGLLELPCPSGRLFRWISGLPRPSQTTFESFFLFCHRILSHRACCFLHFRPLGAYLFLNFFPNGFPELRSLMVFPNRFPRLLSLMVPVATTGASRQACQAVCELTWCNCCHARIHTAWHNYSRTRRSVRSTLDWHESTN